MTTSNETQKQQLQKTPVFDLHQKFGGKMVNFGGWAMPLQYKTGILAEHKATRTHLGLFDVSHMGEFHFEGADALASLDRLVTSPLSQLAIGRAVYTVMCTEDGGIVDDLIVYRLAQAHFLAVVNASNIEKDLAWMRQAVAGTSCVVTDASSNTALFALQGPRAQAALESLAGASSVPAKTFDITQNVGVAGVETRIARTGYTGEDGFEIFCAADKAVQLFESLAGATQESGGHLVGLGARDTLRLEARLSLYGNDLDQTTSPLEAGLGWLVGWEAPDFIGAEALIRQKTQGVRRKLTGFVMKGRGIPRAGYSILHPERDAVVGQVTSGGPGPTVGKNIGLGYVPPELASPGHSLVIDCRGKKIEAEVVKGAFYRRATSTTA